MSVDSKKKIHGCYLMSRGWMSDPLLRLKAGEKYTRPMAWCWIVETACWKPVYIEIKGTVIELKRGQFSYPLREIAVIWGWNKDSVNHFLKILERAGRIKTEIVAGQFVITVCNYDESQLTPDFHQTKTETENGTEKRRNGDASETYKNKRIPDNLKNDNISAEAMDEKTEKEFEEFWMAYPKKIDKNKARPLFQQALQKVSAYKLIDAAHAYAGEVQDQKTYVKYATTWLDNRCWEDYSGQPSRRPINASITLPENILIKLRPFLDDDTIRRWFNDCQFDEGAGIVTAPSAHKKDYIKNNFLLRLNSAFEKEMQIIVRQNLNEEVKYSLIKNSKVLPRAYPL